MNESVGSAAIFEALRVQVLAKMRRVPDIVTTRADIVPITPTLEAWFVLLPDGDVRILGENGLWRYPEPTKATKLATLGFLSRQHPLATYFLSRPLETTICKVCAGSGVAHNDPMAAGVIVCACGGLGYCLASD